MHELSDHWCLGWTGACAKFRSLITETKQQINDVEAQRLLDDLFCTVKEMEKNALNEMPTLVAKFNDQPKSRRAFEIAQNRCQSNDLV